MRKEMGLKTDKYIEKKVRNKDKRREKNGH